MKIFRKIRTEGLTPITSQYIEMGVTTFTRKVEKEVIKMARVVLSGLIQDARGSIGGSTFSQWKGISYLRSKAVAVTNPQTIAQTEMRQFFATSVIGWRALTPSEKALWEEYAQKLRKPNSRDEVVGDFGIIPEQGYIQSGFNAYIGVNQICKGAGHPRVSVPPIPPDPYPTVFLLVTGSGAKVHIEFMATPNPEVKIRRLEIWMKGLWAGAHSYITTHVDVPEPPTIPPAIEITTIRMGTGNTVEEVPFSSIIPCEVLVQGIIVRSDGARSTPTALHRVKVVA